MNRRTQIIMMKLLLFSFLFIHTTTSASKKNWHTLKGSEPVVVARGGYSGICPESTAPAYQVAQATSLSSVVFLCDLQISKDGVGYCHTNINLQNSTTITSVYPNQEKTYNINGMDYKGWFGVDYTGSDLLKKVTVTQGMHSRTHIFDGTYNMLTPFDIVGVEHRPGLWINVQYPTFYEQRKLNPAKFIQDAAKELKPEYISSPEIGFLKGLGDKIDKSKTKLIFKFLTKEETEPSNKETYDTLLQKLPMIKTFASGIVVPRDYIWSVDSNRVLQPATNLVDDAHKLGLEVFASGFANDNYLSYNYSYDPTKEYLQFIDNSRFSVDGVITDFPSTASESIACLSHNQKGHKISKTLIISHDGASGDYPGSSDLAYHKAIDDGADIIDCSVQMSKDGVAFCFPSADLAPSTTAPSIFLNRSKKIPEIQEKGGIFSFDFTWDEIHSLQPQIISPFDAPLVRNPANKNNGKFVTLREFLNLAKKRATTGVLINIENAPYLASKKGLDIVNAVTTALSNATFDKQSTQKVLIQSDDSSVLLKFKEFNNYQRVLAIKKDISGANNEVAEEVKNYADALRVFRNAVVLDYPDPVYMSLNFSNLVEVMHAANVSVYVGVLRNEFQNFLFDYLADPYLELATMTQRGVDGIVTDFPATAVAYMTSPCANPKTDVPYTILPIQPGDMYMNLVEAKPDQGAPSVPQLQDPDIVDPPLPPVNKNPDSGSSSSKLSRSVIHIAVMCMLTFLCAG